MSFDLVSDTGIIHRGLIIGENGSILQYFFEIMNWRWCAWKTNGTETVFKMREQIRYWLFIDQFDESDLLSKSVVKTVHVDEVNGWSVGVVDFGNLANSWIILEVPEVKRDFLLLIYLCMNASLISRRILALTSELYFSIVESNETLFYNQDLFQIKFKQALQLIIILFIPLQSDHLFNLLFIKL